MERQVWHVMTFFNLESRTTKPEINGHGVFPKATRYDITCVLFICTQQCVVWVAIRSRRECQSIRAISLESMERVRVISHILAPNHSFRSPVDSNINVSSDILTELWIMGEHGPVILNDWHYWPMKQHGGPPKKSVKLPEGKSNYTNAITSPICWWLNHHSKLCFRSHVIHYQRGNPIKNHPIYKLPESMGNISIYPLVNVYMAMERSTMLSMGQSTISMAMASIFNSYVTNYQRVSAIKSH